MYLKLAYFIRFKQIANNHVIEVLIKLTWNYDSVNENLSVNNLNLVLTDQKRKCSKVFNFLLGGRRNNNRNKIEWENLCKYQLKSGIQQNVTKSANADNTVRQASSANDHIILVHMLMLLRRNSKDLIRKYFHYPL
ncbi:hypothetical protein PIROE2DRAFT_14795 [Piromyces sp. E2]|nr:hypothetical protein PIROE2DRAFT_14795 [Piromyces sp. E2]|eukprot:OUM59622.1 hypothetical protein PIROE2DRAFT_14795 [Piromyces sp. E2]